LERVVWGIRTLLAGLFFVLVGCAPEEAQPSQTSATEDTAPPEDSAPPEDTDEPPEDTGEPPEDVGGSGWQPELTVETIDDQVLDDSWLFDLDIIHEVDITLSAASIGNLTADPYVYTEGSVVVDGYAFDKVGVRLRGKYGSFRTITGKPKFKVDLNQYDSDQTLWGHETLSLNNSVVDCSYLKEPIAYLAFAAAGVPAPRTAMVQVTVNGQDYGLYVLIETPDDTFLDRRYDDGGGNLYDGKYLYWGSGYRLLDFGEGEDHMFPLEEGPGNDNKDIEDVSYVLSNYGSHPDYYAEMDDVLDWDNFHREQLVEQWVGQNDGYALNTNNYRVYFDPADGKAHIIPWDMDYSFLNASSWGRSWSSPVGNIASACMRDTTCYAAQKALARDVIDAIEAEDLYTTYLALDNLTRTAAQSDPKRECSLSYVTYYRGIVGSWIQTRSDDMNTFWGL